MGNGATLLRGANRDVASHVGDPRKLEQRVEEQALVGREIRRDDLEQEIGASTSAFYDAYRGAALVDFKQVDVAVPEAR